MPPPVNERAADPMLGQTIDGRYIVESLLGEGGMGTVYAARHAIIDKRVAIKVLRKEAAADESSAQRFIIEAKAASKIGHQNIVDITDFGVLPAGNAYFVMEYLDGPTLGKLVHDLKHICRRRAPSPSASRSRAASHAAHGKSIIHRDLKPENIFALEKDGTPDFVKIVDFGIAKDVKAGKRLTAIGMVLGTPEYMSPEQATGQESDHRVDQYALGCILYEMLTGDVPFKGENAPKTLTQHVFDAVVPPSKLRPDLEIPLVLEEIVMRMLQKKPNDRYADMTRADRGARGGAAARSRRGRRRGADRTSTGWRGRRRRRRRRSTDVVEELPRNKAPIYVAVGRERGRAGRARRRGGDAARRQSRRPRPARGAPAAPARRRAGQLAQPARGSRRRRRRRSRAAAAEVQLQIATVPPGAEVLPRQRVARHLARRRHQRARRPSR